MPDSDSPAPSERSNTASSARNLAIASCLIVGIAAVSVRAVVVDRVTPTRARVARTQRLRTTEPAAIPPSTALPTDGAARVVSPRRRAPSAVASSIALRSFDVPMTQASVPVGDWSLPFTHDVSPGAALVRAGSPAQTDAPLPQDPFRRSPLDWRALVALPGVTFGVQEITDASAGSAAFSGARSVRTHSILELTLDMDSLLGWRGLTVYVEHKAKVGRNGSDNASFVQSFSNIDADDFRAMGEVWVEQRFLQDRMRIKAGRIDFNHTFAGTDNGASFLNASMGFSPSIVAAPTYPLPSIGVEAAVTPWSTFTVSAAVLNGRDGAPAPAAGASRFRIAQANQQWTLGSTALAGRVGVGAWKHTGMFSALTAESDDAFDIAGTRGWYATVDQTLWEGRARGDDEENHASVAAFAQFGASSPNVQSIHAHRGGGLTLSGLLAARPADLIGVGVTHADWGTGRETIGELFYQLPVTSHLSLVADVQRVRRLDGPSLRAFGNVATMRTVLSF
jgi:porin